MIYWWLIWIGVSLSPLNDFIPPSLATLAQFLLLLVSFVAGHMAMKWFRPFNLVDSIAPPRGLRVGTFRVRWVLSISVAMCLIMMLLSLMLSGAFEANFVEYYLRIRRAFAEESTPTVTGIRSLDVMTKILFFPLSYTVVLILLSIDLSAYKYLFLACIVNIFCFAYLWQVNYPFIHLFWFLVFYTLIGAQRRGYFNKKILIAASLLFVGLIASAGNRFGGDVVGGFQHYIVQYHLIGFTYYDQSYLNPGSILHTLSFGRSSLGFLDQVLEALLKPLELGYRSASLETQGFNEAPIDIGANSSMSFNAFGTILYSLYRDFNLIGIVIGGFIYGAAVTYSRYRSANSWRAGTIFLMLANAWMIGMMVSPLEEVYFWFTIVTVGLFGIVNRGVRL
jgi:oligosaccharide repeat unit polymerase